MTVSEATIQAILMDWVMQEKHHIAIVSNSNTFFHWEADLLSITRSWLVHEFEIKLNIHDYKRDAEKWKHHFVGDAERAPAYFWYVTHEFEIEPPEKAGWIFIRQDRSKTRNYGWIVEVKKDAPRLNTWKVNQERKELLIRLLSWRLANQMYMLFIQKPYFDDQLSSPPPASVAP